MLGSSPPLEFVISRGNSVFSTNLYSVLVEDQGENFTFSPFSISNAAAVSALGARESTAEEISRVFSFPENKILKKEYKEVAALLKKNAKGLTFATANRVYVKNTFKLQDDIADDIKRYFSGEFKQVSLGTSIHSELVARKINKWVEKVTHGKIRDLISAGSLTSETRMILVNAVYFKGKWKEPFKRSATTRAPFYVNKTDSKVVDLMYAKHKDIPYALCEDLNAHSVKLPYKGGRFSMKVFVPFDRDGLPRLEQGLKDWSSEKEPFVYDNMRVLVYFPKFQIRSNFKLVEPLMKLGATSIFDPVHANFSGFPSVPLEIEDNLYVSEVIHEAFVKVNEEGSEAAATTVTIHTSCCMSADAEPRGIDFRADRPFMFQIVENQTNMVLFTGRLTDPPD